MGDFLEDTLSQMLRKMDHGDFEKLSKFFVKYYFERSDAASTQK